MAAFWTRRPAAANGTVALLVLLGLLVMAAATGAVAVRGQQQGHVSEALPSLQAGPLTLLLLRAVNAPASAAALGDAGVAAAAGLDPANPAPSDELDAFKPSGMDMAAAARAASYRTPLDGFSNDLGDPLYLRAVKRQVRYHQCYFNPISCFG